LWSWIKETGVPHARVLARLASAEGVGVGTWCVAGHLFDVDDFLMVNVTVGSRGGSIFLLLMTP
jgi:hypothetical protein